MSSVVISGDTSGSVTLQAPAVSGSTVLTLPSTTGTIVTASGTATAGGVAYGNGTTAAYSAAGTSGQLLQSNGASAPTWATISSTPTIVRSARTSNTILGTADASTLIDITSGTFSQTFTAAATLGSGWFCYIRNSGTGDITLDPNASELIDGLTSYIMYGGETRLVQCDGSAFTSVVLSPFYRAFTASGTFTKPPGYTIFSSLVWGGGGSGAKDNSACRGGFGGGCFPFQLLASTFGATETITIGAGGLSVTATAGSNAGGATTIGSLARVGGANANMGGAVGTTGTYTTTTDVGGNFKNGMGFEGASVSTAGQISTIYGGAGNPTNAGADGGSSIYGGAAGGGHDGTTARSGGTSTFGGNGGAASVTGNGTEGSAPAGGGGACRSSGNSGAGGRGEVRIWGIA